MRPHDDTPAAPSGLQVFQPHPAEAEDLQQFHTADYVAFLRNVSPDNVVRLLCRV